MASDIARGMEYLHSKKAVHRGKQTFPTFVDLQMCEYCFRSTQIQLMPRTDLKADNCFVGDGDELRVKVADFGTGRIAASILERRQSTSSTSVAAEELPALHQSARERTSRTLSRGVGTLLWMPPEALQASHITQDLAFTLDVYR
jgi:serine/threonine protein kinase